MLYPCRFDHVDTVFETTPRLYFENHYFKDPWKDIKCKTVRRPYLMHAHSQTHRQCTHTCTYSYSSCCGQTKPADREYYQSLHSFHLYQRKAIQNGHVNYTLTLFSLSLSLSRCAYITKNTSLLLHHTQLLFFVLLVFLLLLVVIAIVY